MYCLLFFFLIIFVYFSMQIAMQRSGRPRRNEAGRGQIYPLFLFHVIFLVLCLLVQIAMQRSGRPRRKEAGAGAYVLV